MSTESSVVAVYQTHTEADRAVKDLQRDGVDMRKLSIGGKGYYNTGDRMKYWGKTGAFWGGFWGLLFGSALFMIPDVKTAAFNLAHPRDSLFSSQKLTSGLLFHAAN
jgi:hypothetical protein